MRGAATRAPVFDADWLAKRLAALLAPAGGPSRLVVGWSGGADSTALLAALAELRLRSRSPAAFPLRALHVDHQLQAASAGWARHCRRIARQLRVPLRVVRVEARPARGESREAAARAARYRAFETALAPGEVLLLAQHADDQLETLLLQLLRGAGIAGLAAMPERRPLARGELIRPLLELPGAALREFLVRRGLPWVEDASNADPALDRNYLRLEVVPRLAARWPEVRQTSARSVALLQEARRELDARSVRLLERVADGEGLSLPLLRRLGPERQRGVLRAWFAAHGVPQPDRSRLGEVLRLATLREDAQPVVTWAAQGVRRHADRRLRVGAAPPAAASAAEQEWRWSVRHALSLPAGTLRIVADPHGDLDLAALPPVLRVAARAERRARDPHGAGLDVKSLLRESGVPSWRRASVPFLYDPRAREGEGALLAVADLWLARAVRAGTASRRRGRIVWQHE